MEELPQPDLISPPPEPTTSAWPQFGSQTPQEAESEVRRRSSPAARTVTSERPCLGATSKLTKLANVDLNNVSLHHEPIHIGSSAWRAGPRVYDHRRGCPGA